MNIRAVEETGWLCPQCKLDKRRSAFEKSADSTICADFYLLPQAAPVWVSIKRQCNQAEVFKKRSFCGIND